MDQGSTMKRSAVHNFAPTVTKFCVMWEGQALPHDTKFGNSRCEIVGRRVIFIWSLIHGLRWSGLIKASTTSMLSRLWPYCHMDRIASLRNLYDATPIKQTVFERGRGSPTHWFLCYWRVRFLTRVLRYDEENVMAFMNTFFIICL